MSRLWPETLRVGLFPGHAWLQRGRSAVQSLACDPAASPAELLNVLDKLLDDAKGTKVTKGAKLELIVTDGIATLGVLPWQEALHRPEELNRYAEACLDKQGTPIDDDWVVRAEFARFRANGLAYALPRHWMSELVNLTEAKGIQLKSVLPVSAAAYFASRFKTKEHALLLLSESSRISAMVVGMHGHITHGLIACDVEPVTGAMQDAGKRLLTRIGARYESIATVSTWSPEPPEAKQAMSFISDVLPNAKIVPLLRTVWS